MRQEKIRLRSLAAGLLCLVGGAGSLFAQGLLAPPPDEYQSAGAPNAVPTIEAGGIPPEVGLGYVPNGPFQLGPLDTHPHFLFQYSYGDGIPATPTNRIETSIEQFSPGVMFNYGSHWTLDYTPTFVWYSASPLSDTVNHALALTGATAYDDWTFHFYQGFSYSDSVLLETESQTKQESFATSLGVSRQLGDLLSANATVNQNISSSSSPSVGLTQRVDGWSFATGMNCQFAKQFGVGLSGTFGLDQISPGAGDTYEQFSARADFIPGKKFSSEFSFGLEASQFAGQQIVTPIFNLVGTYRPIEQTAFSVSASRSVSPALFQDEEIVTTSLSATIRQGFHKHFWIEASGGYTSSPFIGLEQLSNASVTDFNGVPIVTNAQETRLDYYRYGRVSAGFSLLKRGDFSAFFQTSDTTSGLSAVALTSTQVGFQLGYRY